jgi:hypothetical protein
MNHSSTKTWDSHRQKPGAIAERSEPPHFGQTMPMTVTALSGSTRLPSSGPALPRFAQIGGLSHWGRTNGTVSQPYDPGRILENHGRPFATAPENRWPCRQRPSRVGNESQRTSDQRDPEPTDAMK